MGYWWQTERPKEATSVQRCWLDISQGHVHSQFKNQPVFLVRNPAPADKANSKRNAFPQGWQTLTFTPHQWMWSDIRPLPASSVNSTFEHLNIWIGPRTQKAIEWHLNCILIISSKSYAKPHKLTVTANAASSQTQTEDMAAKINVTVPFKISHKASPCRGGHCSRDVFFYFKKKCLLIFSFFKKRGGTKKRDHTPSGIRNQISSLFRLQPFFFFCQNERLASYLWWRRSQCSQRWPTEEQPFKCWTQNLLGTKRFGDKRLLESETAL